MKKILKEHSFWYIVPSVILYVVCLAFEVFPGWPGVGILMIGWLAVGQTAANTLWLANPILFIAWFARRHTVLAMILSLIALGLGISFM